MIQSNPFRPACQGKIKSPPALLLQFKRIRIRRVRLARPGALRRHQARVRIVISWVAVIVRPGAVRVCPLIRLDVGVLYAVMVRVFPVSPDAGGLGYYR